MLTLSTLSKQFTLLSVIALYYLLDLLNSDCFTALIILYIHTNFFISVLEFKKKNIHEKDFFLNASISSLENVLQRNLRIDSQ